MNQQSNPLVSVCVVTYNHSQYIQQCLRSILDNGYPSIEVIVFDDGSSDDNLSKISAISDSRLSFSSLNRQGPSANLNAGIAKAKGQYIITFSGDDVLSPGAIQRMVELIEQHKVDLLFSTPRLINEESKVRPDSKAPVFFKNTAKNSAELLRILFFDGNFLCATTLIAKTEVLKQNPFCVTSIQLQDFEKWIHLAKKYKIYQAPDRLVQYRVPEKKINLSSSKNKIRSRFELTVIYEDFFKDASLSILKEAFTEEFKNVSSEEEKKLAINFLYIAHELPLIQFIGLKKFYFDLQSPTFLKIAEEKYNFNLQSFFKLANEIDFSNMSVKTQLKKAMAKGIRYWSRKS